MHQLLELDTHYPIYCDPSRQLYQKLGMMSSLSTGDSQPEYASQGVLSSAVSSIKNMVTSGTHALHGGHPAQNGGELLFGNGGELIWCKRMRHTRDHAEVTELRQVLGLE